MSALPEKRDARFWINRLDEFDNSKYRVLAVILSSVPAGKLFSGRDNDLEHQLCIVLKNDHKQVIVDNFCIDPRYNRSDDLHDLISAYSSYGQAIGLKCWLPDFDYQVTQVTHDVAREVENLGLLPRDDIFYLKEIGKKLLSL